MLLALLRRLPRACTRHPLLLPDPLGSDARQRDDLVLLGGLALLLSRCPPALARTRFPKALAVHRRLAAAERSRRPAVLDPDLLSDMAHEIAEHVDPHTRSAARRCLRRSAGQARAAAASAGLEGVAA